MHPADDFSGDGLTWAQRWAQREVRRARRIYHGGLRDTQSTVRSGANNAICHPPGLSESNYRPPTYTNYRPHISISSQSGIGGRVTAGVLRANSILNIYNFFNTINKVKEFNIAKNEYVTELQTQLEYGEAVELRIRPSSNGGWEPSIVPLGYRGMLGNPARVIVRSNKPEPRSHREREHQYTREFTLRQSDFMRGVVNEDSWMDNYSWPVPRLDMPDLRFDK